MSSLKIYTFFGDNFFLEQAVRNLFLPNQQTKQKQIYSTAQSIVAMYYYYIHFLTQITLKKKKFKKTKQKNSRKNSHIPTTHTIFPFHEAFTFISQVLVSQR